METISEKGRFTLKQILKENWPSFLDAHKTLITWYVAYNIWKVINCRDPLGLGFATFACPSHPDQICQVPRSCKSRFCSVCAKVQSDKWVANMNQKFPNCTYFHITFTVPSEFRTLLFEKRSLLNAVFSAAVETLLSFCAEQGFLPAITAALHTFGSDLKRHIHVHIIISAGGLLLTGKAERFTRFNKRKMKDPKTKARKVSVNIDSPEWVYWDKFPYKMLRKRYQALIIKHLKEQITNNINSDSPDLDLKPFSDPTVMKIFFDDLKIKHKKGFYVQVSEERLELKPTMGYIGRYARRPPLSELRIKGYTGDYVTFEYKDYKNNSSKVSYKLKTAEFIRKLVRHIPPHYFNLIRHYGLLASRVKSSYKKITDCLLPKAADVKKTENWRERQTAFRGEDPLICKICRKVMVFVSACLPKSLSSVRAEFKAAYP